MILFVAGKTRRKIQAAVAWCVPKALVKGCENWENLECGYITPAGVRALAEYKFHSGAYTPLDNLLNNWWLFCAKFIPRWFSPNAVTLTGGVIFMFGWTLMVLRAYVFTNNWDRLSIHCIAGVCLLLYQLFDAMDGKHSRNTQQSTPLGALFDHGCDTIITSLLSLLIELVLREDDIKRDAALYPNDPKMQSLDLDYHETLAGLLSILFLCYAFFFCQWEHYHTGKLEAQGCTEAQIIGAFLIMTYPLESVRSFGRTETGLTFFGVPNQDLLSDLSASGGWVKLLVVHFPYNAALIYGFGFVFQSFVIGGAAYRVYSFHEKLTENVQRISDQHEGRKKQIEKLTPEEEKLFTAALRNPIVSLTPIYVHFAISLTLFSSSGVWLSAPFLWRIILVLSCGDLSLRMIVSGLCSAKFPLTR